MDLRTLLGATLYMRGPELRAWAVSHPESGRRALAAFLTAGAAAAFWTQATPGRPAEIVGVSMPDLAAEAAAVGSLVVDPLGTGLVLERADLMLLARGEVPGEFSAWLRDLGRLGRQPAEVKARLRGAHVHVITGKAEQNEYRLYLLGKSDDGSLAVPCFSAAETLAQFVEVRRLREEGRPIGVAVYAGAEVLRIAAGMGAVVLIDPESPWETHLEPDLLRPS